MENLQEQILARIDQGAGDLGYRPPTSTDIIRACTGLVAYICDELAEMVHARIIDTEMGDSGSLTYRRAKPPYVPDLAPEKKPATSIYPTTPAAQVISAWPKNQSLPTNCAAKQAAQVEATKAKFRKVLAKPLTINEYAKAANSSIYAARNLVARYVETGFLVRSGRRPNLIRVAQ